MRLPHLLIFLISISASLAEIKRFCLCGTQRIPCDCPPESKLNLNNLRNRVFRAFSVPTDPSPKPIPQSPYFVLSRNVISAAPTQTVNIDQPIGYVLTNSPAEAFYLDAASGQLIPTNRPRFYPQPSPIYPQQLPVQPPPQFSQPPLTTASRQSFLVSGGASQTAFRAARMIQPSIPLYANPGVPSLGIPPPGNPNSINYPIYAPYQQPRPYQPQFVQPQKHRASSSVNGWSEPNLVPVSQLTRVIKQRHAKKFTLDKPRPGDVEDFSFVDAGHDTIEEDEIDRKYKSFISGSPPSASIGEPSEVVRTRPRSLLETLPPGLIAKVARKIAAKLPPPKFSFSITPSKSRPEFQ